MPRAFTPEDLATIRELAEDGARRHADAEDRARVAGWPEDAEAQAERVRGCLAVLEALDGRPRRLVTEADRKAIRTFLRNGGQ